MGACTPREGVMKQEEFRCTGKLPHREAQGGLWNLKKAGKAGFEAENRDSCTSQPIRSSPDCGNKKMADWGTERSPQEPCGTKGGCREPKEGTQPPRDIGNRLVSRHKCAQALQHKRRAWEPTQVHISPTTLRVSSGGGRGWGGERSPHKSP